MSLEEEFEIYVDIANKLPTQTSDIMLMAYAYYKQATVGDNDRTLTDTQNIVVVFKHRTWENLRGMEKEDAMRNYIKLIKKLENEE